MKIDLLPVPYKIATNIVQYCIENRIELEKCYDFINQGYHLRLDLVFDIPNEHIIWMRLKGLL